MKIDKEFIPWRIIWTPEHVKNFWDWWGSNPALLKHYFSYRNGAAVIDQIKHYIRFSGVVVDLGAGPGFIVDLLVSHNIKTIAVDTSPESLAALNERMQSFPTFLGTRVSSGDKVPMEDGEADVVLLIETIEHLSDGILQKVFDETFRVLKPGGWIAITTPNNENLAELENICPNCGCVYHSYQHVRSWPPDVLKNSMAQIGFNVKVCKPTLFSSLPPLFRPLHRIAYKVLGIELPHLIYIGQKPLAM